MFRVTARQRAQPVRREEFALVEDGDIISIDIPTRALSLDVPDAELDRRRAELEANGGYKPKTRVRTPSSRSASA